LKIGSFSIDHNLAHYAAINRGALFLACKAKAVEFNAGFYAVQALELAAGFQPT
jgi:formylmethanofuran:tetrahydromethanopterin formyltransferase